VKSPEDPTFNAIVKGEINPADSAFPAKLQIPMSPPLAQQRTCATVAFE
jgi:hypothetical protein